MQLPALWQQSMGSRTFVTRLAQCRDFNVIEYSAILRRIQVKPKLNINRLLLIFLNEIKDTVLNFNDVNTRQDKSSMKYKSQGIKAGMTFIG